MDRGHNIHFNICIKSMMLVSYILQNCIIHMQADKLPIVLYNLLNRVFINLLSMEYIHKYIPLLIILNNK